MSNYTDMLKVIDFMESLPMPKPSSIFISTRSAKCFLKSGLIDMKDVVNLLKEKKENNETSSFSFLTQFMFEKFVLYPELLVKKERINSKPHELFYNQATVIVDLNDGKNPVNIKFFINGGISIVGCKTEEGGKIAVDLFLNFVKKEIPKYKDCYIDNYEITCINSDFRLNYHIDRTKLYSLLNVSKYYCDFDPVRYPGVEIIFKYHKNIPKEEQDGICNCFMEILDENGKPKEEWIEKKVRKVVKKNRKNQDLLENPEPIIEKKLEEYSFLGNFPSLKTTNSMGAVTEEPDKDVEPGKLKTIMKKVQKKKECKCKNVTIFVFQSGSVIITGSNTMEQLEVAYKFTTNLFKIYFKDVRKITVQDCQDFLKCLALHKYILKK